MILPQQYRRAMQRHIIRLGPVAQELSHPAGLRKPSLSFPLAARMHHSLHDEHLGIRDLFPGKSKTFSYRIKSVFIHVASSFHFSSGRESCPRFNTMCCRGPEGVRTDSMSWCCIYLFLPFAFLDFSRINITIVYREKTAKTREVIILRHYI